MISVCDYLYTITKPSILPLFSSLHIRYRYPLLFFLFFSLFAMPVYGQKTDTTKKVEVIIKKTRDLVSVETDSGTMQKFIGDVIMQQDESMMYCDSAFLNSKTNNLEAFGHVKIIQTGGTQASSDYMRYTGNAKLAYLKGNVTLLDPKGTLKCDELTYNTSTKTGVYTQGGNLQSDSTNVTSRTGTYNSNTKDSRFGGNVIITDPRYHITSEDLTYNTETKIVAFFAPSIITSDKSSMHTTCGTFDSKSEIGHFPCHSFVWNEDQYLEGDTINYSKISGMGIADGHVISFDTTQHATLYSGHADYNRKTRQLWATIKPVLKQINNNDSLFIRADTFYSAPMPKKADSLKKGRSIEQKKMKEPTAKKKKITKERFASTVITHETIEPDTSENVDSTAPRYYIGYHHVLIFSDSLQGRCDSISYTQSDSLMRMIYKPVAWSRKSQITGDTILLKMDSSKLKRMYVPNNAFVISQSGPAKAQLFDQIQGKRLIGNFVNNAINDMLVFPEAECIYYSKDEKGAYLGVNQGTSDTLHILFNEQKIDRIYFIHDVHQTLSPLDKVNLGEMRLSRFHWLEEERPKSREELFK